MSLNICWDRIVSAADSLHLTDHLNQYFDNEETRSHWPKAMLDLLGRIHVSSLKLGSMAPECVLRDLVDPFDAFYVADAAHEEMLFSQDLDSKQDSDKSSLDDDDVRQQVDRFFDAAAQRKPSKPRRKVILVQHCVDLGDPQARQEAVQAESAAAAWRHPLDTQAHIHLSYQGDAEMTIQVELCVNYPCKRFMVLPVVLHLSNFVLSANAVVAYLNEKRLHVSFMQEKGLVQSSSLASLGSLRPTSSGGSLSDVPVESRAFYFDVHIESEIGDKTILKDVAKVERFVIEQLRKFIQEKLVYPNCYTIDLEAL